MVVVFIIGLDIDEYNHHDFLQACLIEGIAHFRVAVSLSNKARLGAQPFI